MSKNNPSFIEHRGGSPNCLHIERSLLHRRKLTGISLQLLLCSILMGCSFSLSGQSTAGAHPWQLRSVVSGRIDPVRLTNPLRAGEKNQIPVVVHGGTVSEIRVWLNERLPDNHTRPFHAPVTTELRHRANGDSYVEIAPDVLGSVQIRLEFHFSDGDAELSRFDAEILLTDNKPDKLIAENGSGGSHRISVTMRGEEFEKHSPLIVSAVYAASANPIHLPLDLVTFRLLTTSQTSPAIQLDESEGRIIGLHPGHALIDASFRGTHSLTCVVVHDFSWDGQYTSDCSDLVPSGMESLLYTRSPNSHPPRVQPYHPAASTSQEPHN
jgi:hypothetical protein